MSSSTWEPTDRRHTRAAAEAARRIARAKETLASERRRLAEMTRAEHKTYVVASDWEWAYHLLRQRWEKLLGLSGVVGCGLGFRRRGKEVGGEPCITVYVSRKLRPETLEKRGVERAPKYVYSDHGRLDVDVVELGRLRHHATPGGSLGRIDPANKGTLACFAVDRSTGENMALTAGHVTGAFEAAGRAPFPITAPSRLDDADAAKLGLVRRATLSGIDAAKIALLPGQTTTGTIPRIGPIRGWRPLTFPGDKNTPVRMVGAVSGLQQGRLESSVVSLPGENLDVVILADIESQKGDSGSALVDPEGLVLGFLVGEGGSRLNDLRVFTPAGLVLDRLDCEIHSTD